MKRKKTAVPLENQRVEKLAALGARLRQARQSHALTLEQLADQTRIQRRFLQAIEEGRIDQLPEPVYVQGFIRRFAESVGLDGADFAHDFPVDAVVRSPRITWRSLPAAQLRPIHLYLLYIALIGFAVNSLSDLTNRSAASSLSSTEIYVPPSSTLPGPGKPIGPQQPTGKLDPSNPVKPVAPRSPWMATEGLATILPFLAPLNSANGSVQVSVTLKDQSWMRVVSDGKTSFEGVLPQGTQRTWAAQEKLTVRAGNAGGVMIAVNNGQLKPMGDPGSVEEVTVEANPQAATLPRSLQPANPLQ